MATIKHEDTVEAIAREYCSNGRRKARAMRAVGYSESSSNSGRVQRSVYSNARVQAAIARIDAETGRKLDLTREAQYRRLLGAYDIALEQRNVAGIKAVLAEINEMLGYHRENAPNEERERAVLERMSEEDRELARLAAQLRTAEEARKNVKLA